MVVVGDQKTGGNSQVKSIFIMFEITSEQMEQKWIPLVSGRVDRCKRINLSGNEKNSLSG